MYITTYDNESYLQEGMAGFYAQAIKQNNIIFERLGLKVFAAAHHLALLMPSSPNWRSYNLNDAVAYLNNNPVHTNELRAWATEFGIVVPRDRDGIHRKISINSLGSRCEPFCGFHESMYLKY